MHTLFDALWNLPSAILVFGAMLSMFGIGSLHRRRARAAFAVVQLGEELKKLEAKVLLLQQSPPSSAERGYRDMAKVELVTLPRPLVDEIEDLLTKLDSYIPTLGRNYDWYMVKTNDLLRRLKAQVTDVQS